MSEHTPNISSTARSTSHKPRNQYLHTFLKGVVVAGVILHLVLECMNIIVTIALVFNQEQNSEQDLVTWVILVFLYLVFIFIQLSIQAFTGVRDYPIVRKVASHVLVRILAQIFSIIMILFGIVIAFSVVVSVGHKEKNGWLIIGGSLTMILTWFLLHWSYARIYFGRYYRAKTPPLIFPETTEPNMVDFVYFSFTVGISFATSDVTITDTRMRWTTLVHSIFSFFFNALIIVLAMNVFTNGSLLLDLLHI